MREKRKGWATIGEYDISKAVPTETLSLIGAVSLVYNQVEAAIDVLLRHMMRGIPNQGLLATIPIDTKLSILRDYSEYVGDKKTQAQFLQAIGEDFNELKRLRNSVVHARFLRPKEGIAQNTDRTGVPWKILITPETLQLLYDKLYLLNEQLYEYNQVLSYQPIRSNRAQYTTQEHNEQYAQNHMRTAQRHHSMRLKLARFPPLPEPEEPETIVLLVRDAGKGRRRRKVPPAPSK